MGGEAVRELYKMVEEKFNAELIKTDAYQEVCTRRKQKRELLETCLGKEEYAILKEYLDVYNEVVSVEMEEAFVKGFTLANQLLIDSLR